MKVAISVPDPVFEAAEQIAARLHVSRSQLYTRALETFVRQNRGPDVKAALEEVYGSQPSQLDPVLEEMQAAALREEW